MAAYGGNGGAEVPVSEVWDQYISPYFKGSFHTGKIPPVNISFTPYTAVVDMRDGTLIAKDAEGAYLTTQDILDAVNQANQ